MTFRYNPFNKISGSRKSAISKTSEREFEREIKKIENLQDSSNKIQENMKRCIKSQSTQSKYEVEMLSNLQSSSLYKDDEQFKRVVDFWAQSVKQLDIQMDELNSVSNKAVVEPMKKFSTIFPSLHAVVRKRENSLQEFTKCQEKVEKYLKRERTGLNAVKLENSRKACATAKMEFDQQNDLLMDEVPKLYEGRIAYFQPSLQALVKAQTTFYKEAEDIYSKLYKYINEPCGNSEMNEVSDLDSDELYQTIQQKLNEIRSLSIAVDDQIKQ